MEYRIITAPLARKLSAVNDPRAMSSDISHPQFPQRRALTIRECGSTLYVGLARATSPTNTNFRLTFLLTRLQGALYEDLPV